ncbi:EscU/YscU/HrcU family type III secretion system export apparatus switch protein [Legionella fairfieldensis]|uniref:EscU/YscU/HrcU family type III secretion system export apparatus switch protein n=1 Tax=Legionella fairfieldensis TaxID=45064 RepID=UPI0004900B09|nr:EscU/YscU/HrcU family type III secretion system export apparatus switch protein [Legionella fairfieldensis]
MSEKTETATPFKLQKAKEKGHVSKSMELNVSLLITLLSGTVAVIWPSLLKQLNEFVAHLLYLSGHMSFTVDNINRLQRFILQTLTLLWLPFALIACLCLIVTTVSQTGFVWSTQAIAPDFKRINWVQGFKRLFSSRLLFDTAKNSLKLGLAFILLTISIRWETINLLQLMNSTPIEHPGLIMHLLLKVILQLLLLLLILAVFDKIYTHWKYNKDNRMSKQEVKDEYRQREGDPKIKGKLRQLQQQLRQKTSALNQIKTADVIITNPTHLAIALKYERGVMPAPKVVCKAQGEMVQQVRILARRHNIPVIENKAFARALFDTVELNQWIRQEHFPIAAMILREIYRQKEIIS